VTPETAIRARIAALSTTASTRVYLLKLPQSPTLPAVRVQLIDDFGFSHLRGGGSDLRRARVQVDAYSREASGVDPYETAAALADAINGDEAGSGLSGFTGTVDGMEITAIQFVNRQAMYEGDEQRLVRVSQDFFVWYRPA
jgi:hypothetical protein